MACQHTERFRASAYWIFEVECAGEHLLAVAKLFDRFLGRRSTGDDATPEALAGFIGYLIENGETCYSLGMIDLAVNRFKPDWRRSPFMAPVRSCSRSKLHHAP